MALTRPPRIPSVNVEQQFRRAGDELAFPDALTAHPKGPVYRMPASLHAMDIARYLDCYSDRLLKDLGELQQRTNFLAEERMRFFQHQVSVVVPELSARTLPRAQQWLAGTKHADQLAELFARPKSLGVFNTQAHRKALAQVHQWMVERLKEGTAPGEAHAPWKVGAQMIDEGMAPLQAGCQALSDALGTVGQVRKTLLVHTNRGMQYLSPSFLQEHGMLPTVQAAMDYSVPRIKPHEDALDQALSLKYMGM